MGWHTLSFTNWNLSKTQHDADWLGIKVGSMHSLNNCKAWNFKMFSAQLLPNYCQWGHDQQSNHLNRANSTLTLFPQSWSPVFKSCPFNHAISANSVIRILSYPHASKMQLELPSTVIIMVSLGTNTTNFHVETTLVRTFFFYFLLSSTSSWWMFFMMWQRKNRKEDIMLCYKKTKIILFGICVSKD